LSRVDEHREVTGIVLFFLAVAVTLIFYLPVTFTGVLGVFIRTVFLGLLGYTAYSIPLFLLYSSIDFFFEKRAGVSSIRVRSVILLLICISTLLSLITCDFDYFAASCIGSNGKASAVNAIVRLWKSGSDADLIANPAGTTVVIPGGIIGGGIAVAVNMVIGRTISILAVIVFILSQIVTVFHISIKKAAKKTAVAINQATRKAYDTVSRQPNNQPSYTVFYQPQSAPQNYPGSPVQNAGTFAPQMSDRNAAQSAVNAALHGKSSSPFVNTSQVSNGYAGPAAANTDPFASRFPIDLNSGFVDVSSMGIEKTKESGSGSISYNENVYKVSDEQINADFGYTAEPLNPPVRLPPKTRKLSFLDDGKDKDFIDLTPVSTDASSDKKDIGEPIEVGIDSDYPSEDKVSENEGSGFDYSRKVRKPYVEERFFASDSDNDKVQEIPGHSALINNADSDSTPGYSATEGRILETSEVQSAGQSRTDFSFGSETGRRSRLPANRIRNYRPAPTMLLAEDLKVAADPNANLELQQNATKLEQTLKSFGIEAHVVNITHGPAITRYELTIATGTKVSRVTQLQDDIMLSMAAISLRIEAPIPGKSAIGIEIPNKKATAVQLRSLVETREFKTSTPLTVALGRDIPGRPVYCDLAKMPHLMIAGSTGSGKSVCINAMLTSILVHASPNQVRMILIDPKVVELSVYNGIPHLISPVITDCKKAAGALKWAVAEMQRRYKLFEIAQVRDIKSFNKKCEESGDSDGCLPLILVVIDELAELMMVASKEVELYISRLAALARAAGLHLIIATQRPSVDVITGVIKANIGSRIAFAVTSGVDSRTILDQYGAEKLLGKGDMLYAPMTAPQPIRGQGAFLTDEEVESVIDNLKSRYAPMYDEDIIREIDAAASGNEGTASSGPDVSSDSGYGNDNLFEQAVETILEYGSASVSVLQRRLGVGYPRAARLVDELEKKQIIGPFEGSKPRKILINKTEWLEMKARNSKNG
jgi:DNA segregation ATPase FtsK/SpoIIIE-like protein